MRRHDGIISHQPLIGEVGKEIIARVLWNEFRGLWPHAFAFLSISMLIPHVQETTEGPAEQGIEQHRVMLVVRVDEHC